MKKLEDIPNIGPKVAARLRKIGVTEPADLKNKNPLKLYEQLNKKLGRREDSCVLDVFMSAVAYVNGAPARPWWYYTPERKTILKRQKN
jgi:hypothetical protein